MTKKRDDNRGIRLKIITEINYLEDRLKRIGWDNSDEFMSVRSRVLELDDEYDATISITKKQKKTNDNDF